MNDREAHVSISRRDAIAAAVVGTATAALAPSSPGPAGSAPASPSSQGGAGPGGSGSSSSDPSGRKSPYAPSGARMPVVYAPHGGGPWPFVDLGFSTRSETDALLVYLRSLKTLAPAAPRALLVVSAHWEAPVPTVMTGEHPPLFFDYYGFPPETYRLTWPAPGDPKLAARTRELLGNAGFASADDARRGFDHGTFVPLKITYPGAEIPTVQLSLKAGLDPAEHLAIGRSLAPLRDAGVLIVGSGMSYHNMRGFGGAGLAASQSFDAWLRETTGLDAETRDRRLSAWTSAPSAREVHPREEHLLPLMVVAGAAGADRGRVGFEGAFAGVRISAHHFG